jgi:hypothetical protein
MSLLSFKPPVNRKIYEDALYMALKDHLSPQFMAKEWLEEDTIGVNRLMHVAIKKQDAECIVLLLNLISEYQTAGRHAVMYWQYCCFIKSALRANADLKQAFQSCLATINCNSHSSTQSLLRIPNHGGNLLHVLGKDTETGSKDDIQCSSHKNNS